METVTAPASASYEVAVQRQMIDMAHESGRLRGELRVVRITLNAILLRMEGWRADELRGLIERIDIVLAVETGA